MMLRRAQAGLSLIELLVALALGAFLILGVVTVFVANKRSSDVENSLSRVQESGRFIHQALRRDLHAAQYLGCNTGEVFLTNMIEDPNDPTVATTLQGVRGYENTDTGWTTALPTVLTEGGSASIQNTARVGSDVLIIRTARTLNASPTGLVDSSSTDITLNNNPGCEVAQGTRIAIAGCALQAHLFEVSNAISCSAASAGSAVALEFDAPNLTTTIEGSYDTTSEVLISEVAVWYIADTGRDRNGADVWALFRRSAGVTREMLEGVENLQVRFGHQVNGNTNLRFVDPSDALLNTGFNYETVKAVQLGVLVQGFDTVRDGVDAATYRVLGVDVPAGDGTGLSHSGGSVQREVFNINTSLRNAPEI